MDTLLEKLADFRPFVALVVGDFMLDEMIFGDAERLSADAPVPVLRVRRTQTLPGGAANLCLDLAALGGTVHALGAIGNDPEGTTLRKLLESDSITSDLVLDPARPTTVKRNMIGLAQHRHPQKMFRVDHESDEPLPDDVAQILLTAFKAALPDADLVCIEDYDKGVCSEHVCQQVIALARDAGKPVFVDPASLDSYTKYRGATAITPNRTEAERATRLRCDPGADQPCAPVAAAIQADTDADAVVLTLDRMGALLLEGAADPVAITTTAREVYDVSGAGDMFLAALAAARANDTSWPDAVRFANAAAGLEVEVFGVAPIPLTDIRNALLTQAGHDLGPLRTLEHVLGDARSIRQRGGKVVFTNGCFDILHPGHIALIQQCATFGDYVVIGLNDDDSVRRLKGHDRPVNTALDRARVLGALQGVDAVVLFAQDTPLQLIEAIRPDVLVKGADYSKDQVVGAEIVERLGGRVVLIELVPGSSTTGTIAKLVRS
ncbi:MAG: D-glycero-beta-D-manno-heptose 1-phosphate adenylyltransferase [Planctomycetes bacterium]|nr:D-glycero-beta-D-manno-heptose 1-phosphate adenylyltransferase [Planctomycetota bacterium]